MKIIGLVELEPSISVSSDLLGGIFNLTIASQPGTLAFPFLPDWQVDEQDPLHKLLVGPEACRNWKQGESLVYWGKPQSYPDGESDVYRAYLEFEVPDLQAAQAIYSHFPYWKRTLYQYIRLSTTQGTDSHVEATHEAHSLSLYENTTPLVRIPDRENHTIIVTMSGIDESLHANQLIYALDSIFSGKAPRIEYRVLLNALMARLKEDYRMLIIEAANAVEICLHSKIKEVLTTRGIDFADELLRKYSMLGGKLELATLLSILPTNRDYRRILTEPRKNVVHRHSFQTSRER